ncbi:MAG: photosynthetic complex assembly protein PuhC [Rhodobacter sp.]|nr:photosynthetic complex assembly protein PuhC [Rhodobacter sp.]MCY4167073.1 photosynthetic complex assembly protein PuhC [Rhodobacter sp.]MCY4242029.1 photosynthetic complex assembly protein PuhC [Rhodobacter sp.]
MSGYATARVYSDRDSMLPRGLVRGMLGLVCAVLALVTFARVTDRPLESVPPVSPVIAEARLILESDAASGAVAVSDMDGAPVADLSPEEGGFVAGVHRVILRERIRHRVSLDSPVVLQSFVNGRMAITDPATGWRADLMGFGADNANAFARLLAYSQKGNQPRWEY